MTVGRLLAQDGMRVIDVNQTGVGRIRILEIGPVKGIELHVVSSSWLEGDGFWSGAARPSCAKTRPTVMLPSDNT